MPPRACRSPKAPEQPATGVTAAAMLARTEHGQKSAGQQQALSELVSQILLVEVSDSTSRGRGKIFACTTMADLHSRNQPLLSQGVLHVCMQVGEEAHRAALQACERGLERHHLAPVQHAFVAEELDGWALFEAHYFFQSG